jgi:hypothetical protein
VEYPLGLVGACEDLGDADFCLLRATMSVNRAEGSISFAGEIPEGATVHLTCGDSASIVEAAGEAARLALAELGEARPALVFFYCCMARKTVLGWRTADELRRVRDVLGRDIPILGFYTYGEFCPLKKGCPSMLHNETATISIVGTQL